MSINPLAFMVLPIFFYILSLTIKLGNIKTFRINSNKWSDIQENPKASSLRKAPSLNIRPTIILANSYEHVCVYAWKSENIFSRSFICDSDGGGNSSFRLSVNNTSPLFWKFFFFFFVVFVLFSSVIYVFFFPISSQSFAVIERNFSNDGFFSNAFFFWVHQRTHTSFTKLQYFCVFSFFHASLRSLTVMCITCFVILMPPLLVVFTFPRRQLFGITWLSSEHPVMRK